MNWRAFWDGDHPIYVNDRHKAVHYRAIADSILALGVTRETTVLDYACGEALEAGRIAGAARRLVLCDGAPSVVAKLAANHAGDPAIAACLPEDLDAHLADGAADLVVVCSLIQYLSVAEFEALLDRLAAKLAPGGRLVVADVLDPASGMVADVISLVRNGLSHGYGFAALAGLARTLVSPYRKMRAALGLTAYPEAEFVALLARHGLSARRVTPNLGLTQHRMTFLATR